jgi:hypothetical protein
MPKMKTSTCKAKGRRLQSRVRDSLMPVGKLYGLEEGDIKCAIMGVSGQDIKFSPAADKVFPFDIECKNKEKLVVMTEFVTHYKKYKDHSGHTSLLIHSRNNSPTLVTLMWEDFLNMYVELLRLRAERDEKQEETLATSV